MSKQDDCKKRYIIEDKCPLYEDGIPDNTCDSCKEFKSRYIVYPIEVEDINIQGFDNKKDEKCGKLVSVRPCSKEDNPDDKTFLGILLGNMVIDATVFYTEDTKELRVFPHKNPAIFVPELKKIIWGMGSWWGEIKSEEQLRQITDEDINNVWYVKALKQIVKED
jgi:hypothetical protein